MKVAVAQTRPATGDFQCNVVAHRGLVELAAADGADMVVFPELSLTGYEPKLARDLAIELGDHRLDVFQDDSDTRRITIGVGAPTKNPNGTCISLILFQPGKARQLYSKGYLHPDVEAFFVPGQSSTGLTVKNSNIALAICYELSVAQHASQALENGAEIYVASVAKPVGGIENAQARLCEIAREYSVSVLMSNCLGMADDWRCAGRTSAWNNQGVLVSQLDDAREGLIVFDTQTQKASQRTISAKAET